ncbi:hypothetical protein SKAU_G00272640 [Synaphobranchus kaupii]|uniref:Uncharacterized protein n=1 Tax=Synaphobranchus kaupii TaxID=118154 RepID=A0A9Q1IPU1_SYNKA|nr:hypothetical protein SKAU_G00272640 [Synaphobranchus kaupii]
MKPADRCFDLFSLNAGHPVLHHTGLACLLPQGGRGGGGSGSVRQSQQGDRCRVRGAGPALSRGGRRCPAPREGVSHEPLRHCLPARSNRRPVPEHPRRTLNTGSQ